MRPSLIADQDIFLAHVGEEALGQAVGCGDGVRVVAGGGVDEGSVEEQEQFVGRCVRVGVGGVNQFGAEDVADGVFVGVDLCMDRSGGIEGLGGGVEVGAASEVRLGGHQLQGVEGGVNPRRRGTGDRNRDETAGNGGGSGG